MSDQIYMPLEKQEQMTIKKEESVNIVQEQEFKSKTAYEDAMRYQEQQKQKEFQLRQEEENISGERVGLSMSLAVGCRAAIQFR